MLGDSTATATPAVNVRCIAFSRCGNFLAAATDDKTTYLWSTDTWQCIKTLKSPKKISAVGFSGDGSLLLAANKFGDVGVTSTADTSNTTSSLFELFLGHYCSVITSLSLSHDGTLLATTDRDGKVRINKMPASSPLEGCHEIQCFGFGHTDFVSCATFVQQGENEVLISGGGDGTLRMWNKLDGSELAILQVGTKADEPADKQPVLAVCPSQDGKYLLVALDGVKDLCIVSIDVDGEEKMVESGRCGVDGVPFATDICVDATTGKFYIASGPLQTTTGGNKTSASAAAVVVCCELDSNGKTLIVATSEVLTAEVKTQLQKFDESQVEIEKIAPQKMLPAYLHKRAFVSQEEYIARRKALKTEHGAGPSAGAVEETEDS